MDQLQRRQIVVEIPRRSSLEIDPAAIHQRRLRHSWLPRHLEALCLLYRFYDNSPHEFVNVFNKLFENDLQAEGFEKGLNYGRLVSRWNSIKDWDGGHDMWVKINITLSRREARIRYRHLLDDIEEAALELGISLVLRVEAHHGSLQHSRHLGEKAKRLREIRGVLGETILAAEEVESNTERPKKLRQVRSAEDTPRLFKGHPPVHFPTSLSAPAGVSLVRRFDETGAPARRMPCLVYRWHDEKSNGANNGSQGFRAGMFQDQNLEIPPPPTGDELRRVAQQHLSLANSAPSSFISTFDSMLPALRRALHSAENAYLTIIDLRKVERDLQERFEEKEVLFPVFQFVKGGMRLEKNYSGSSEWLVYGLIEQDAIVSSFKIDDLMNAPICTETCLKLDAIKHASSMSELRKKWPLLASPMTRGTGAVIQRFLQFIGVPDQYKYLVAAKMANTWAFQPKCGRNSPRYKAYMDGIFGIRGSVRANSVLEDDAEENEDGDVDMEVDGHSTDTIDDSGDQAMVPDGFTATKTENEEDLIDRQFEADCPEICAETYRAWDTEELKGPTSHTNDHWAVGVKGESSGQWALWSGSFAKELMEVADYSPVPQTAQATDWEGSPWRSVTPHRPAGFEKIKSF